MNDNINPMLNRFLIERRSKRAIHHRNEAKTFSKFTKLFKVSQGHGWITGCFTIQDLNNKTIGLNKFILTDAQ